MLNILCGSVFDKKCDLLILPRSSSGTMTSWVLNESEKNKLPLPESKASFGSIIFIPTGNKYRNTYYVGYASSVNGTRGSSIIAISSILDGILQYIESNDIGLINLPVLGTGAGKLDINDVLKCYKSKLANHNAIFNVYIPNANVASAFVDREITSGYKFYHPRVFISYAWEDESVQKWAMQLTKNLCSNGVNARIDKYHVKAGFDLPQWMTDEIIKADKVLLICDEHYAKKADMRKAGVGWETMIVQGDMYIQGTNNKYISINYGDFNDSIPRYLKSKLAISKEEIDKDIKTLLVHLFDLDYCPVVEDIPKWIKEKL